MHPQSKNYYDNRLATTLKFKIIKTLNLFVNLKINTTFASALTNESKQAKQKQLMGRYQSGQLGRTVTPLTSSS